uniref:Uncharacterized protein n=1 Tax=Gorilla gorilla gorilla TaxID=9595 RepID=A0A2I2ZE25_GORGO
MPLPVNLKCQGAGCYPRQPCLARGGEQWHHGWSQAHLRLNLGSSINYPVREKWAISPAHRSSPSSEGSSGKHTATRQQNASQHRHLLAAGSI